MNTVEPVVFVVDDDPSARKSLCALAQSMDLNTIAFESAEEFLASYQEDQPGCLITDVRMLGMSGIELQDRLNEADVFIPVIVITAFADTQLTVRAMQNGALTLLEKPCRDQELWEAIRNALQQDEDQREERRRIRDVRRRFQTLSEQELRVLHGIVAGNPNKVIAKELDVSIRTIESRRHDVFDKMGCDSVAELVRHVVQAGCWSPPAELPSSS